jgi:hypothetical protein
MGAGGWYYVPKVLRRRNGCKRCLMIVISCVVLFLIFFLALCRGFFIPLLVFPILRFGRRTVDGGVTLNTGNGALQWQV